MALRVSGGSARHCICIYIYMYVHINNIYIHTHIQTQSVLKNLRKVTNKVQLAPEYVQKMGS